MSHPTNDEDLRDDRGINRSEAAWLVIWVFAVVYTVVHAAIGGAHG